MPAAATRCRLPGVVVGRAPGAGLVVDDDALSRSHAFVGGGPARASPSRTAGRPTASPSTAVRVRSATTVDAAVDDRGRVVDPAAPAGGRGPGPPLRHPGDGTVRISPHERATRRARTTSRSTVPQRRPSGIAGAGPVDRGHRPGARRDRPRGLPRSAAAALRRPRARLAARRRPRRPVGVGRAHRREVAAARGRASTRGARPARRRAAQRGGTARPAHPDPAAVLVTAEQRAGRRSGAAAASARVRLGSGDVPTRVAWVEGSSRTHPAVGARAAGRRPRRGGLPRCRRVRRRHRRPARRPRRAAVHGPRPPRARRSSVASSDAAVVLGRPPAARCRRSVAPPVPSARAGRSPASAPEVEPGRCGCWWFRGRRPARPGPRAGRAGGRRARRRGGTEPGRAAGGVRRRRGTGSAAEHVSTARPGPWRSCPTWSARGGPTGCRGPWPRCAAPTPRRAAGCRRGSPSPTRSAARSSRRRGWPTGGGREPAAGGPAAQAPTPAAVVGCRRRRARSSIDLVPRRPARARRRHDRVGQVASSSARWSPPWRSRRRPRSSPSCWSTSRAAPPSAACAGAPPRRRPGHRPRRPPGVARPGLAARRAAAAGAAAGRRRCQRPRGVPPACGPTTPSPCHGSSSWSTSCGPWSRSCPSS